MKQCTHCQAFNADRADHCSECGAKLPSYAVAGGTGKTGYGNSSGNTWMYVCTFFIPILGIILGCIKLKEDEDLAKKLIIFGIVLTIIYIIISGIIIAQSANEVNNAVREAESYLDEANSYLRN